MAEDFKWDEFETEQPGSQSAPETQEFDWEAHETEAPVEASTDSGEMGTGERFARGVAQGASLGFADEATGGLEALLDQLKGSDKTFKESYQQRRDESRDKYKEAQDTSSGSYGAGQLVGGAGTLLIPGLNVAKGATLAQSGITAARAGAAAGLGSSEADLTEGELGQAVEDTGTGALLGGAAGTLFPALGKLYKPSQSLGGAVTQGLGLSAAGAGLGGAYGAATEDLNTPEGREAALRKAALGAGVAGASRALVGAGRTLKGTGIGSEIAQDIGEAYTYGKEGISLVGKKARDNISNQIDKFSQEVANFGDEALSAQKQGAFNKQLHASKELASKVDSTRKLIGQEIGDVYNNAANDSADFTQELQELDGFLKQNDLNLDEKASLRNLGKQMNSFKSQNIIKGQSNEIQSKGLFGEPVTKSITGADVIEEGFKPLQVKEYLNLRKEVADLAYGVDTPGSVRKLAKEFYKRISDKGVVSYLDPETAETILPALNKEYSLLTNIDDLLGQGKYITAEGAVEAGPQATKYVKNLGEKTLAPNPLERTQSVSKTLKEVDPQLLEDTAFQAKQAGQELRDVADVEKLADPVKLKQRIPDLEQYNPNVEQGSEYQKLLNQLAKKDASKTKSLLDQGQDLAKQARLSSQVAKEGDKTVFSPRAAAFKALASGATYGNLAGQAARKAEELNHPILAKALRSVLNKDAMGRNAVLFTIMQNPELRKQYDEVMGTSKENE